MDVNEALYTTRAMRRVSPKAIPDEQIARLIDAAIRAPSGGNNQNWRFVTVTDPDLRSRLGPLYRDAFAILQETIYKDTWASAKTRGDDAALRVMSSSRWLADNFETVPLWVLAFHRNDPTGASIYPAVWNLMLAARSLNIGTCLTTILGIFKKAETFEVLGVPLDKGWELAAAVSCGYPTGRWGLARRSPAQTVAYAERWGNDVPWSKDTPEWTEPTGYP